MKDALRSGWQQKNALCRACYNGREESECAAYEKQVQDAIEEHNRRSSKPYELSLSMGTLSFEPGIDTIDTFMRRIDERMYENKQRRRERLQPCS